MERFRKKFRKSTDKLVDFVEAGIGPWRKNVLFQCFAPPSLNERCKRLLIFAHYSDDGSVHPYVYHYLNAMNKANCDILFVSSSGSLKDDDLRKLQSIAIGIIVRRNFGYDFASWWTAVKTCRETIKEYSVVIFANDSVYGPLGQMEGILSEMEKRNLDMWAMTSSTERGFHLQSYFWALSNQGLNGPFFDFFWNVYYKAISRRQKVIDRYELLLAKLAQGKFGLRVGAYTDVRTFIDDFGAQNQRKSINMCNPLHHFGYQLLCSQKCPFIKRELLTKDPFHLNSLSKISEYVEQTDGQLWHIIDDHLRSSIVH